MSTHLMKDEDEDVEVPTDHTRLWAIHLHRCYYLHQKELPLTQFCGMFALTLAEVERSIQVLRGR